MVDKADALALAAPTDMLRNWQAQWSRALPANLFSWSGLDTAGQAPESPQATPFGTPFNPPSWPGFDLVRQAGEYWLDAWQRSVLFLDVLRRRGNEHFEHIAQTGPNVLSFAFEVVMDGRHLDRPVNYCLTRIIPPADIEIDSRKRPFIVFDPRAGHGPGIGGMKQDSEIGVALQAGHPCYFVGFLPEPVPGQTIEDVCQAEAIFVRRVGELHPHAEGKPSLIGNCQAGWQIMMMSATHPDIVGPIVLAGAPLAYWAGVHGKNPLRYLGGLLGGTWLTSLTGDLGHGIFDGANLVSNFESMNPSNTLWKKNYHLFAKVDTEAERFLEFEKWWGSPVLLNAAEMQFIADELFIGNKLTSGEMFLSDNRRIDLRNIKSPIIVFCSWGDDITPPQQALGWVLDLYDDDEALIAGGQTIVYAMHQSIGHLGIFVSAKVATKEHEEFTLAMDLVDALPPGLYEAVFTERTADTIHPELVAGDYVVRFERRSLNDIRALGGNDAADDRRFATVARLSEINQSLYRTTLSPFIRSAVSEEGAEWLRHLHPHRIRYEFFSDKNPSMALVAQLADSVRAARKPAAPENLFLKGQEAVSDRIVEALDKYRDTRDKMTEAFFINFYGSPAIQAMVGLRSDLAVARLHVGRDIAREASAAKSLANLETKIDQGGLAEAGLRALLYIGAGLPHRGVDERSFATLRALRQELPASRSISQQQFKSIVKEQYLLLHYDEERAISALPKLLPADPAARQATLTAIHKATEAAGDLPEEGKRRLAEIEALFADAQPELTQTRDLRSDAAE